jgi:SPP1 gp7 family putative phage head morphogenesis protein
MAEEKKFYGKYIAPGRRVGVATPSAKAKVRAMLASVNEEVAVLPRATLRRLRPVLDAARMELERDLAKWLSTVEDGALRFTAHKKRAMLRQIREAMRVIDTIRPTMTDALTDGSKAAAGMANSTLSRELARMSAVFDGQLPTLDIPTVAHLVEKNNWLVERYERVSGAYTENFKRKIRRELSIGVAKGESVSEMSMRLAKASGRPEGKRLANQIKRMNEAMAGNGMKGVDFAELSKEMSHGLSRSAYTDQQRIVRTELMHAYNQHELQAAIELYEEDEDVRFRWDAMADRRCVLCNELDAEVVIPGEPFSSGHLKPPRHPNCRCRASVWMDHWAEVEPLDGGPGKPIVTRGGTAKETNVVLRNQGKPRLGEDFHT